MEIPVRVGIFADSLSLPRPRDPTEPIRYSDVYPSLVAEALSLRGVRVNVENFGKRNRTSEGQLDSWIEDIVYRDFDFIILQLGINDCAPRLLSRDANAFFNSLPSYCYRYSQKLIKAFERIHILRRTISKRYVKEGRFTKNIASFLEELPIEATVIIIGITPPNAQLTKKSPDLAECVSRYNKCLAEIAFRKSAFFIPIDSSEYTYYDGIHLNHLGHRYLSEKIMDIIIKRML